MLYLMASAKINTSKSGGQRISDGEPCLIGHVNIGSLLEVNARAIRRDGTVRIEVELVVLEFKILS